MSGYIWVMRSGDREDAHIELYRDVEDAKRRAERAWLVRLDGSNMAPDRTEWRYIASIATWELVRESYVTSVMLVERHWVE